ncbi:hypothetical protein [Bradyrhizobium sp. LA2.1]|uniref:hypothetical protein n=1 Tax=Bradyrhizobium sp. LA2.1 TaxID=3156376 RepID=UPI0033911AAF
MTTILLNRSQASALWYAIQGDGRGGLKRRGQRWEFTFNGLWFKPSTVESLLTIGLLRRVGSQLVRITDAGRAAFEENGRRRQGCKLPHDAKTLKQIAAEADEAVPEITCNADGSIEFKCAGCGEQVFMAVDDGYGFPACFECRWFGEHPHLARPEARP